MKYFDRSAVRIGTLAALSVAALIFAVYLKRGVQMFMRRSSSVPRNTGRLGKLLLDNFVLQKFITERSTQRWIMHACLSWGGMLAFAMTFPLVFGWSQA